MGLAGREDATVQDKSLDEEWRWTIYDLAYMGF